jgi:uncharacterized protein YciI
VRHSRNKAYRMKLLVIARLKPSATGAEILRLAAAHASYLKRLETEGKLERHYLIWAPSSIHPKHTYCDIEVYEAESTEEVKSLLKNSPIASIADYEILQVLTRDQRKPRRPQKK